MKFAFCHRVVNGAVGKKNTIKNASKNKATPPKKKQTNNWEQHILRSHLVGPHHVLGWSPQNPEQQRARRKEPPPKKKCYGDLKVSNRPQANIK
jgi:hypothetical protein